MNCGCTNNQTGSIPGFTHDPSCEYYELQPEYPTDPNPQPVCKIDAKDIFYLGSDIPGLGITNGMNLPQILQALDLKINS